MSELIVPISSVSDLLAFLSQDASEQGNLSIRGVARMAGVEHTSIIRDGAFASQLISEKLTQQGFEAGALCRDGFPPQAVILVLEYFAYESKAKAPLAKQLMRTFGTIGTGSGLGGYVARHVKPNLKERVGRYDVNHYRISPELDETIHAYFR